VFSRHVFEWLDSGVGPGQEFVDAAIGMAVDDLADHVGEIGVRVDAVEFAGLNQRSDDRPMFAAAVGTSEDRVLSTLESISMRPSSRKRVRPPQRDSA
jgi:hypothetical protein